MKSQGEHWEHIYATRAADQVSWYERSPKMSLELVHRAGVPASDPVLDVGAGASTFADVLVAEGFGDISLLDLSETALEITHRRLGATRKVGYVVGDVTAWEPPRKYALWHDRAVFHFLTDAAARAGYRRSLAKALAPGGKAIVATFDLDGPERCSGLPVQRFSAATLAAELSDVLSPVEARHEVHVTPSGTQQSFVYCLFERLPSVP
jgi:SAM-dependent methyltransferase